MVAWSTMPSRSPLLPLPARTLLAHACVYQSATSVEFRRENATSPTSQGVRTRNRPGRAGLCRLRHSERNALEFMERRRHAQGKQQALRFG